MIVFVVEESHIIIKIVSFKAIAPIKLITFVIAL